MAGLEKGVFLFFGVMAVFVALMAVPASMLVDRQPIGDANISRAETSRNAIYVDRDGNIVGRDATFQQCEQRCASICEPEYPYIAECLRRQSQCTYRCDAAQR